MRNTLLQPAAFLTLLYGGMLIGIVFDIMRLIRRLFRKKLISWLADILFVLAALLITAGSMLLANDGVLRLYLLAGLLTGFIMEHWSIGYLLLRVFYAVRARL